MANLLRIIFKESLNLGNNWRSLLVKIIIERELIKLMGSNKIKEENWEISYYRPTKSTRHVAQPLTRGLLLWSLYWAANLGSISAQSKLYLWWLCTTPLQDVKLAPFKLYFPILRPYVPTRVQFVSNIARSNAGRETYTTRKKVSRAINEFSAYASMSTSFCLYCL